MGLIINQQNPKNVKYNLRGSGLIHRPDTFCKELSCKSTTNPTPTSPVPKPRTQDELVPIVATKQGPATNKWELKGIVYPTFNSLWVNIPRKQFTLLRRNG